jgi:hypothetical protein
VLTSDGLILTNAHVVTLDGETNKVSIEIKTSDGVVSAATVVGIDPTNDLAVIKANGVFTPIEFADSSKVNVGDNVVAIGAPLGLEESVTTGILSALNRTIQVASSAVPDGSLQLWNGSGWIALPAVLLLGARSNRYRKQQHRRHPVGQHRRWFLDSFEHRQANLRRTDQIGQG